MIDLSSHIEYLLLRHDCVVVPGLGAFLIHEEAARYDSESSMFFPPRRMLGFNPSVTVGDGLLVESLSRKEGISIETASQRVESEVSAFRHQLARSGELPVGSLGVLSVGSEPDALLFEPAHDNPAGIKYFGLTPFEVHQLAEESAEPETAAEAKARPIVFPLPLKIAASLVFILVACGLLYSTTNLVGGGSTIHASLDSGLSGRVEAIDFTPADAAKSISREIVLNIAKPVETRSAADSEVTTRLNAVETSAPGRYLLVVASFPSAKAADRHISYLGDKELSVIEMDGNYRVYVESYDSKGEAYAAAEGMRDRYPNVWVCRR